MGRRRYNENPTAKVRLFRVDLDSGGYDSGGAYWGFGDPLYCVMGEDVEFYLRADDRDDAKDIVSKENPGFTFYR